MNQFIPVAFAEDTTATTAAPQGLSIDFSVVAFQAVNVIVLLIVLNLILYKPLSKLLADREKRIKEGVENAEKADVSLRESKTIREDMMKSARVEGQTVMDKARKDGETLKNSILAEAQNQAKSIVDNGHQVIAMEKAKTMEELKAKAVGLIVMAAEKVIREKMDAGKDAKMIEDSLNSYAV
jgi:F-type H+-transporting ATPase subunit b